MAEELHDATAVVDVEVEIENEQKTCSSGALRINKQQQQQQQQTTTNIVALNTNLTARETPNVDNNSAIISQISQQTPVTNDETVIKKTEGPNANKQQLLLQDLNITPLNADVSAGTPYKPLTIQSAAGKTCRFPKLEECAHFHYERVQLGALSVSLVNERVEQQSVNGGDASNAPTSLQSVSLHNMWFLIRVNTQQPENFLIKRSFDNMKLLDEMLHRCVYDRKISGLLKLKDVEFTNEQEIEYLVGNYLERFSKIASDSITCGTILTWLQLDNKGRRLPLADDDTMRSINTPAVGAAYGVRRYQAQAQDEISIELGDMISVIDMPTPAESVWWRGKKSNWQKSYYEVGFFPQSCVATIGDKVPRYFPLPAPLVTQVDVSPTKPVLRKHGKLIAFFRSFILSRPSRRRLKQSGIYRERVFSCDLSEHLLNSAQEIPLVLKYCAEFIEAHGIVDGIYRLSGITSTIQRLRQAFDEERVPDLGNPEMRQDIHAVSSLLKMYFRELPNPLCTYQLYDNFVAAVQVKSDDKERLRLMKETVIKLPPPHYRTLRYLARHLYRISQFAERTGMTDKNLAIVWAPNLLRSPALEAGGVAALRGVGVQAVVTEFLIRNSQQIFNDIDTPQPAQPQVNTDSLTTSLSGAEMRLDSLTDCESLLVKQREFDQSMLVQERPKSINVCGAKLISLEEAQERRSQKESLPIGMPSNMGSYIEVGGGPASLPDKYHTVLAVPRSWQKRKTHSWKSIFSRNAPKTATTEHHNKHKLMSHNISKPQIQMQANSKLFKVQKTKSVEFFDTNKASAAETANACFGKGSDLCLRSNSIDSLRTAGHSRSVSHDSYFDLLQSPLHHTLNNTSPSRELTELELNFDREEPEMRIFSESESLVSSPRVGKENLPPNYVSFNARRIIRARPEEFFSQTNNINPSPKKQPRLNLLLSPKSMPISVDKKIDCVEINIQNNEHFSKRYKFEDQFPDIQYIDCSTPEHTISSTTAGTQKPIPTTNTTTTTTMNSDLLAVPNIQRRMSAQQNQSNGNYSRYSYPSLQLGGKRLDIELYKDRFSYPVSMEKSQLQNVADKHKSPKVNENLLKVGGMSRSAQRNSYYGNNEEQNGRMFLRSNSTDCTTKHFGESVELLQANSKVSMTPSSTAHSPHYTLLGGDTSSENSSTVNTPQFEVVDGLANAPILMNHSHSNAINESEDSLEYEEIAVKSQLTQMMDKKALRNELSLDLTPFINKTTTMTNAKNANDYEQRKQISMQQQHQQQQQQQQIPHLLLSPNSSIMTDNTSASVTPSEFGYQALQRQSSTNSLLDMDDEAAAAILNKESPLSTQSLLSPIQKSTISITYNLRSEKKPKDNKIIPIEPKFDENAVYEQVKMFRNSVSEINEIFHSCETPHVKQPQIEEKEEEDDDDDEGVVEKIEHHVKTNNLEPNVKNNKKALNKIEFENQIMNENEVDDNNDCHNKQLLYENVQLRKPHNVYANVLVASTTTGLSATTTTTKTTTKAANEAKQKTDLKSEIINLPKGHNNINKNKYNHNNNNNSNLNNINNNNNKKNNKTNFSVKELANKFESSKTAINEQQQQTQQIQQNKKITTEDNIEEKESAINLMKNAKLKQKLHNAKQITRSLDETAFQREFNAKQRNTELTSSSVMQLQDELADMVAQRRKSFDFTRPKTLNQPKRLPGMSIVQSANRTILEQSMENECQRTTVDEMEEEEEEDEEEEEEVEEYEQQSPEILITPTTEAAALDFSNPNLLSGVKLDRERIDRIKEERRQQLTQKYGMKSRSKTELNTDMNFNKDVLKARSKSRGDISDFELDRDDNYLSSSDMNLMQCKRNDANQMRLTQNRKSISLCQKQTQPSKEQQLQQQNVDIKQNTTTSNNGASSANDRKPQQQQQPQREFHPIKRTVLKADDNIKQKYATNDVTTTTKPRIHASSSSLNNDKSLLLTTNKTKNNCEQISPQFSIRDVTAMFESRSQSQH